SNPAFKADFSEFHWRARTTQQAMEDFHHAIYSGEVIDWKGYGRTYRRHRLSVGNGEYPHSSVQMAEENRAQIEQIRDWIEQRPKIYESVSAGEHEFGQK